MFHSRNVFFQKNSRFDRNDLQKKIIVLQFVYNHDLFRIRVLMILKRYY